MEKQIHTKFQKFNQIRIKSFRIRFISSFWLPGLFSLSKIREVFLNRVWGLESSESLVLNFIRFLFLISEQNFAVHKSSITFLKTHIEKSDVFYESLFRLTIPKIANYSMNFVTFTRSTTNSNPIGWQF